MLQHKIVLSVSRTICNKLYVFLEIETFLKDTFKKRKKQIETTQSDNCLISTIKMKLFFNNVQKVGK